MLKVVEFVPVFRFFTFCRAFLHNLCFSLLKGNGSRRLLKMFVGSRNPNQLVLHTVFAAF